MKVMLTNLDTKKYWEDEQLRDMYGLQDGDLIEVRYDGEFYYPIDMQDIHGMEMCLYSHQIILPVRVTRLAKRLYPDAIIEDGWMWIKK